MAERSVDCLYAAGNVALHHVKCISRSGALQGQSHACPSRTSINYWRKLLSLMPFGPAITAILTLFLCVWCINMARTPKRWRLWWMSFFGVLDLNSTRDQRRRQEAHLAIMAYFMCLISLATCASCIYWAAVEYKEYHRPKTRFELDLERTRKEAAEISAAVGSRKSK
ncbi:MAG: hypothetical protein ACOYMN_12745 [Roseimicrobium sp.]